MTARPWMLGAGVLVALLAVTALDAPAHAHLRAHMLQHLALGVAAPALIAAGAPVGAALRALPRRARRLAERATRGRALGVAVAVQAAVLLAIHVPAVFDGALAHPWAHALEHWALLGSGTWLWATVLRAGPIARFGALLAAMVPMAAVGAWLMTTDVVRYAPYARALGPGALGDQRDAAGLMWAGGTLVLAVAAVAVAVAGLLAEERRQRRREALR